MSDSRSSSPAASRSRKRKRIFLALFVVAGAMPSPDPRLYAATPRIDKVSLVQTDQNIRIAGMDFGKDCSKCEVLVDYGNFLYATKVKRWSDHQIVAKLPDLGKSTRVGLKIKTADGISNSKSVNLVPKISPPSRQNGLVKAGSIPNLLVHEFRSGEPVGDKGELSYNVSQISTACGKTGYLFEDAHLLVGRRTRFGDAKILGKPEKGCVRCRPVKIRYYYEPTGNLHFQLHIYRREITGICADQVRR